MNKKISYIIFFSIISLCMFLCSENKIYAANGDKIDFLVECDYKIEKIQLPINKKFDIGNKIKILYTSINAKEVSIAIYLNEETNFSNVDKFIPFGSKDTKIFSSSKFLDNFNAYDGSTTTNGSFKKIYSATGSCPKYITTHYNDNKRKTLYAVFENEKNCDDNCPFSAYLESDNYTIYREGEFKWEYTIHGDGVCDNLNISLYISNGMMYADYVNSPGSKYISIPVVAEPLKDLEVHNIYNIVHKREQKIYVNPNENDKNSKYGLRFNNAVGNTYCTSSTNIEDYTKVYSCNKDYAKNKDALDNEWKKVRKSFMRDDNKFGEDTLLSTFSQKYPHYFEYLLNTDVSKVDMNNIDFLNDQLRLANILDSRFNDFKEQYKVFESYFQQNIKNNNSICKDDKDKLIEHYSTIISKDYSPVLATSNVYKENIKLLKEKFVELGDDDKAKDAQNLLNNAEDTNEQLKANYTASIQNYKTSLDKDLEKYVFKASSGCKSIEPLLEFLQLVLDWIRIAGIVLAVLMQIVDYVKVIFGSNDDSMVKANKHLSIRLIAVALLFLLPSLITFILALFNIQGTGDAGTCGII